MAGKSATQRATEVAAGGFPVAVGAVGGIGASELVKWPMQMTPVTPPDAAKIGGLVGRAGFKCIAPLVKPFFTGHQRVLRIGPASMAASISGWGSWFITSLNFQLPGLFSTGRRRIQRRRGLSSWKSPGCNTRALPPPNLCKCRRQNSSSRARFQNCQPDDFMASFELASIWFALFILPAGFHPVLNCIVKSFANAATARAINWRMSLLVITG